MLTKRLRNLRKRRGGKMRKPTKKQIAEMRAFANRSATSTMDAIGKKCLRSAVEHKDWDDDNIQSFLSYLRESNRGKDA